MPVIPQYNAAGPAKAPGPTLQREQTAKVDPSQQLNSLSNLAGTLRNSYQPIGGVSAEGSSAIARGASNLASGATGYANASANAAGQEGAGFQTLGQGISAIGQAVFNIRESEADARNYADVHAAQVEMDRQAGEFEKWKVANPDPRGWLKGWQEQSSAFSDSYITGKDLSPVAQEEIQRRMGSFISTTAVNTDVAAIKQTNAMARQSLMANYERAVEAGDLPLAASIAQEGVSKQWIGEDMGVRMAFSAKDQIEGKQIEILDNQKKTALLYGDQEGALAAIEAKPIRADERELERASVTEQFGYNQLIETATDELDPAERIKLLNSKEYEKLRPSDRQKMIDGSHRELNQEAVGTIASLKDEISIGGIPNVKALKGNEIFNDLSPIDRAELIDFMNAGAQNDIAEFMTLQRSIRGYDPANDPRGFEKKQFEQAVALRFEGDKAQELIAQLEELSNPERQLQTPSQRVVSDMFSNIQKRFENGELGEYRITGDQISEREGPNGEVIYTIPDPNGEFKDPGWLGTYSGRVIKLSERDRLKFQAGENEAGDFYEDLISKNKSFGKFQQVQQEIDRLLDAGELTDAKSFEDKANELMGGELKGTLEASLEIGQDGTALPGSSYGTISGGLFPGGSATVNNKMKSLLDATGY